MRYCINSCSQLVYIFKQDISAPSTLFSCLGPCRVTYEWEDECIEDPTKFEAYQLVTPHFLNARTKLVDVGVASKVEE